MVEHKCSPYIFNTRAQYRTWSTVEIEREALAKGFHLIIAHPAQAQDGSHRGGTMTLVRNKEAIVSTYTIHESSALE